MAPLFEELGQSYKNYKSLANWLLGPVSAYLNQEGLTAAEFKVPGSSFLELLKMVDEGKISFKAAKEDVFPEMMKSGGDPKTIVEKKGLSQISDTSELEGVIAEVVSANPKSVEDYKGGKANALMFLVGQVMRKTKGKANPNVVNELLKKELGG